MKTAYYTFTTWNDGRAMAAGFDSAVDGPRRAAMVRRPERWTEAQDGGKIIDLAAWRTTGQEQLQEEELSWEGGEPEWDAEGPDVPPPPAPRTRRSRRSMLTAELVSTLSVVAVAAVLIVRVLTF